MKVAIYPGSFNPFHRGHYNILLKAEAIFDQVIIARGVNPEKAKASCGLPKILDDRTVMNYDGLLTDFIKTLPHDVKDIVVIRGLRNATDLQYEITQYRFLQEFMPEIKLISIFCDKEFEHISSSAIRYLSNYQKHWDYLLK